MRILVLIHEYPPIGGGGGRVAQDISEKLVRRGHEVCILTPAFEDLPSEEEQNGVKILRLKSGRKQAFKAGMDAMLGYVLASFSAGLRQVHQWKPDVIHVHFAVPAGASAWAISRVTGTPYVLTAHLGDVPGGVPEKTGKWFRFVFPFTPPIWKKAARVVAVSEFTRSLAVKNYPVEVDVIPNGVDLRLLDPGEIKINTPPCIVFAGRFAAQKNLPVLVKVLSRIKDLPWNCVLLGDGAFRPEIEKMVTESGLRDRFELKGWVDPAQVIEQFRKSDILFMPSLSEGLPVVGVQAMAMGLALVLSTAGGNIDLVKVGENGFLSAPHNEEGFEQSLRTLLTDPQKLLNFRLNSRKEAASFDLELISERYEKVFLEAAGQD